MSELMEKSAEMFKTMQMKGFSAEVHTDISSPEANKDDFRFALPEGAVFKESLFDGFLRGTKAVPKKNINPDKK
jgi:hypothetical protein